MIEVNNGALLVKCNECHETIDAYTHADMIQHLTKSHSYELEWIVCNKCMNKWAEKRKARTKT